MLFRFTSNQIKLILGLSDEEKRIRKRHVMTAAPSLPRKKCRKEKVIGKYLVSSTAPSLIRNRQQEALLPALIIQVYKDAALRGRRGRTHLGLGRRPKTVEGLQIDQEAGRADNPRSIQGRNKLLPNMTLELLAKKSKNR